MDRKISILSTQQRRGRPIIVADFDEILATDRGVRNWKLPVVWSTHRNEGYWEDLPTWEEQRFGQGYDASHVVPLYNFQDIGMEISDQAIKLYEVLTYSQEPLGLPIVMRCLSSAEPGHTLRVSVWSVDTNGDPYLRVGDGVVSANQNGFPVSIATSNDPADYGGWDTSQGGAPMLLRFYLQTGSAPSGEPFRIDALAFYWQPLGWVPTPAHYGAVHTFNAFSPALLWASLSRTNQSNPEATGVAQVVRVMESWRIDPEFRFEETNNNGIILADGIAKALVGTGTLLRQTTNVDLGVLPVNNIQTWEYWERVPTSTDATENSGNVLAWSIINSPGTLTNRIGIRREWNIPSTGALRLRVHPGDTSNPTSSVTLTPAPGSLLHVVQVHDASTGVCQRYVNGVLVDTATFARTSFPAGTVQLRHTLIGGETAEVNKSSRFLGGALYTQKLSATDVAALYASNWWAFDSTTLG